MSKAMEEKMMLDDDRVQDAIDVHLDRLTHGIAAQPTKAHEVKLGNWVVPNAQKGIAYRVEEIEQTRPGRYRFGFADDKYAWYGGADDVMVLR